MAHQLSILNPHPERLPGPSLLNNLVPSDSDDGLPAIEHLYRNGSVERITYDHLHRRANVVARALRTTWEALTSTLESAPFIVPILIPQCPELYISELATLRAGAAFCPISLDVPEERLRFILNDVNAKVLLTTAQFSTHLPQLQGVSVINVDEVYSEHQHGEIDINIKPSQPAYIMYTSGSTGQPKGVILSHSAVTQSLLAHDRHIPTFSRFLQFASPTFDVSVFEIFFPLFRGRTVVTGERRMLLNDLPAFINRMNVDAAELTPSVASTLLSGRAGIPSLKTLLTIGEMLKRDVVENFATSSFEAGILHGMYGPTEAAIHCTLQTSFSVEMSTSNIGVPLDTVSAFIVAPISEGDSTSQQMKILPIGEEGELAIGGHQLADGYLNRTEQTAASFVRTPEYGVLYRTGDRARLTSTGKLECLGRISSGQVKLRGQRVELGEIEYAATNTVGVDSTVADVYDGNVVVFCVTNIEVAASDVRRTCQKWLTTFMVPSQCIFLRALPYVASGKVDRNALREMYRKQELPQLSPSIETTETTDRIIEIISAVLHVPVTAQSRLPAIGLDSLLSIRIASKLRKAGFPQLDAADLLKSETIQEIETRLSQPEAIVRCSAQESLWSTSSDLRDAISGLPTISERLHQIEDIYVPTTVQLAMLSETARYGQAYCNWVEFSVAGHLILSVQECLELLVSHHGLLRSGFLRIHDLRTAYAVIEWKTLPPAHIIISDNFEYDFAIRDEEDLLHPCWLQLSEVDGTVRILLQIHHALYDQWSVDVFRADLEILLSGHALAPRPAFHEISAFQDIIRQDITTQKGTDFWQDLLLNSAPTPFPAMNGTRVARKLLRTPWHDITTDLHSIRGKCRDLDCSIPTIFQAATSFLLGRYLGSSNVTFGIVVSGRHIPVPGIEDVFGPCLATLPFRIDYAATRTRLDLLRETQRRTREIQKHSNTPLVDIKQMLECSPNSHIFDILFVWQESTLSSIESHNIVKEIDSSDHHEFNLVLEFRPEGDTIQTRITFQQALISSEQVDVFLGQLEAVCESIVLKPKEPVETLSSCFSGGFLSISNPFPSVCAAACKLETAIENHALEQPDSPAIAFARSVNPVEADTEILTYAELNERSKSVTRFLRALNVLPGDLVCICMEKSIDLYVSILATIKAGAGYLPLTPDTPLARIESILKQSRPRICLTDDDNMEHLQSLSVTTFVSVNAHKLLHSDSDDLVVELNEATIAYTVFTSGSTGEPKGVEVSRLNLLSNLQALKEIYRVNTGDRLLQACSQAFDVSVFEIFFAFYTGMCLCSAPKDELFHDIETSIRALRITHLSLTPTVAALVAPDNVPNVKFLVTAGEGVTELLHRRWAGRGLHQGYGPSETTNICTLKMGVSKSDALGNIGRPLRNTSAFVISPQSSFEILPLGSSGEFAFGGEQVFRGYVGMEALTKEKLIDHPEFGRIYKSGDIGRMLPDGSLLISGRKDDQVKLRGNRVELGEISSLLLNSPAVHDCATILVQAETTGVSLVSFVVVLKPERAPSAETQAANVCNGEMDDLLRLLQQHLPSYMLPDHIVPLNHLPLTSQGKLDKEELQRQFNVSIVERKVSSGFDSDEEPNVKRWSLEEQQIAAALQDTIQITSAALSRNKPFFSFGLNSLNSIFFSKALQDRIEMKVALSTILNNPSIAKLARTLLEQSPTRQPHAGADVYTLLPAHVITEVQNYYTTDSANIERILPCTPLQEAMLASGSPSARSKYRNRLVLKINGSVDKIKQCWISMIARHTILRTHFAETTDPLRPYVQVVLKDLPLPWREQHLDTSDASDLPKTIFDDDVSTPVDQHNPFTIQLLTVGDTAKLVLNMHHAIHDEISMSRLLHEAELTFRDIALNEPAAFEPFLSEVQQHNSGDAIEFWTKELKDFSPTQLPRMPVPEFEEEFTVQRKTSVFERNLDSFCQRQAVNHLAVFQAALAKVLACCQATSDVCFGNVVSGRTVPVEGVETLVAPCFNTIPVRTPVAGMRTNLALIRHLSRKNSEMLLYQLTSLRQIQRLSLDPSRRLFETLLILQHSPTKLDGAIWTREEEFGEMGLPFVFEIVPDVGGYTLVLHVLPNYASPVVANILLEAFNAALVTCLKYPDSDAGSFDQFRTEEIAGCLRRKEVSSTIQETPTHGLHSEWTSAEQLVRQVYSQVSKVHEHVIGRGTSMYQLGLDSLNAPQVASRLRRFGYNVDAANVMERPTPMALAALMDLGSHLDFDRDSEVDFDLFHSTHLTSAMESMIVSGSSVEAIRPCTSVQNGMLAQSLASNGKLYINHITWAIPHEVQVTDIEAAWDLISARHQILRMGFRQLDNDQHPFAMVIWRPGCTTTPLVEKFTSGDDLGIEHQASHAILSFIDKQPWRVTIQDHTDGRTMMLSLHHALYDARSLSLIMTDFAAALAKQTLPPPTEIDTLLKATLVAEADYDEQAASYWKDAVRDISISKFPDLTPTVVQATGLQIESHTSKLSVPKLERFCRRNNATIQAVGQSTWALLLAAYTGNDNVVFGTVFASQATTEATKIAFPCITTTPVLCNTTCLYEDLIRHMVDFNSSSQRHRCFPLWKIQALAASANQALFDTVFVYQKSAANDSPFRWLTVRETAAVEYSVSLELEAIVNNELTIRLTYNPTIVPQKQARLIIQQYDCMLAELVTGHRGDTAVSGPIFSISPPLESTLASDVELLHEFFERSALQHPSRTAFEFVYADGIKTWSYSQLDNIANQVAHTIRRSEVEPNAMVAVCMAKCPEASFAFLGILKAGCSFLAVDPDLPESRLKFILEDSGSKILFGDKQQSPGSMPASTKYIHLTMSALSDMPVQPLAALRAASDATCYCLYTSGTTGTPKGCEISHENAVQAMLAFMRLFDGRWTERSRWLQFASYWFDVSILEQFWSWAVGIVVVGAPRDLVLEDLTGFIRRLNITHIDLTPSLARLVHPSEVPSLWNGVFITGGEPLKQEIIEAWGPVKTVCNGYGPTETTIGVTMNRFVGPNARSSNIGRQFDNVGAYVLYPGSDEPVLRGTIGELCISGKLVGKGYLNRPDLTAKQFPYLERFGETVYRTGDLVRILEDGSFTFVGRADSQSKLRGQRLELTEVESVIRQSSEQIHDVIALVARGEREESKETLISFLAVALSKRTDKLCFDSSERSIRLIEAAQRACVLRLPRYMVPTYILAVDQFPLTVNNKIDTKQLIALFRSATTKELLEFHRASRDSRPLNKIERRIYAVLQKLLRIAPVEITPQSNLFSLGLSSISAISFVHLLKQAGFICASMSVVMQSSTIETLGLALSTADQNLEEEHSAKQVYLWMTAFHHQHLLAASKSLSISISNIEAVLPCTPLQQGLIVESLKNPTKPHFNQFRYGLVDGEVSKLKSALQALVDAIQILRTRFIETNEGFAQAVVRQSEVHLTRWSTQTTNLDSLLLELRAQWQLRNNETLQQPLRFDLIETEQRPYLILQIHHALYDGISYELLLRRFRDIYRSITPAQLGPTFTTALAHGPLRPVSNAMEFWTKRLRDVQYIPLLETAATSTPVPVVLRFALEKAEDMESVRRQLGVSHQAIVQTCFEVAFHELAPRTQVYGVVCSGRSIELEGADRVMGPLFNTLPQRLDIHLESTIAQHTQRCHSFNTESIPYQHTPLRDIRKWCEQQFTAGIFDALFVFQQVFKADLCSVDEPLEELESVAQAHYPFACEAELDENGDVEVTLLAQEAVFTKDALREFQEKFCEAYRYLLSKPHTTLQAITGITVPDEVDQIIEHQMLSPNINGIQEYTWSSTGLQAREIIAEISNMDPLDIDEHTSVFALGLDSIDAVKLATRFKHAGFSVPVGRILQAQTIPKMLEFLDQHTVVSNEARNSPIELIKQRLQKVVNHSIPAAENMEKILPATPLQEALVADMLRSELNQYFSHDVLHLSAQTDVSRLKIAWQKVIDLTPVLRTSFLEITDPDIDCTFVQIVHPSTALPIAEYALNNFEDLNEVYEKIRLDVLSARSRSPLIRLSLASMQSERYLVLSLAHALYDGHSVALLHEDVHRAYRNEFKPRPPYEDAIDTALAASQINARDYWTSVLSHNHIRSFPGVTEGATASNVFPAETCSELSLKEARTFCKENGVSMQALAQTCWAVTLAHYTRSLDVRFGVVLACRDSEEREQVMFPMMNTVVMRSSLHGSRARMVQYMQGLITDVRPYQRTPLRTIQSFVANDSNRSSERHHGRLFDTLFIYQQRPTSLDKDGDVLYESIGGRSAVEYTVAVEIEAIREELVIRAACSSDTMDGTGTKDLIRRIDCVLYAIITQPNLPTVDFQMDGVALCGLEPVSLHTSNDTSKGAEMKGDEANDEVEHTVHPLIPKVMQVLSEVSKTPLEEINHNSILEGVGIDSISAIKVAALLRKQSINITVSEIVRARTPASIAAIASNAAKQVTSAEQENGRLVIPAYDITRLAKQLGVETHDIETVLPATAGQVYMLGMWKKTNGQQFSSTFSYRLQTSLTLESLEHAWSLLVDRHAILRTIFFAIEEADESVVQVVLRDAITSFKLRSEAQAQAQQPMVSMHATSRSRGVVLDIGIHHALYDAVSLPLLMQDLGSLLSRGSPNQQKLKFEDFLALSSGPEVKLAQKPFWTQYLQGANPHQLPQPTKLGAQDRVEIYKPQMFSGTTELDRKARKENLTVQALLFAAYAKVYASLISSGSGQHDEDERADVVVGIYLSNRSHLPDLDNLPAPTLNLVPLVVRAPLESSLLDLARQIQGDLQSISTVQNSAAGLVDILEWTGVRVDTFVNLLKLPGREQLPVADDEGGSVVLEELDERRIVERCEVVPAKEMEWEAPPELKELRTDAYQHSLDIEMTLKDGGLGVGLFCPESMLSLAEAEYVLQELKMILEKFVGKEKARAD